MPYEPFKGCDVVLVAAPRPQAVRGLGALSDAEATRLRAYLLSGGNMVLALGAEAREPAPAFAKVLEPFGIALDDLLVIEAEPTLAVPESRGDTFVVVPKTSPLTMGLVPSDELRDVPKVVLDVARPLRRVSSSATVTDLLATSPLSFAVNEERATVIARTASREIPEREGSDCAGPFVLAMASEGLKATKDAPHGPRVVVVGFELRVRNVRVSRAFAVARDGVSHGQRRRLALGEARGPRCPRQAQRGGGPPDERRGGRGGPPVRAPLHAAHRVCAWGARGGASAKYGGAPKEAIEMSWRKQWTSFLLVAVAVALGVWLWVDCASVTDTERAMRPKNVFSVFRRDELSRVEIDKTGEKLVLARDVDRDADASWRIESPEKSPADPAAVDQLTSSLEFATFVRKVDPKAYSTFDSPRASGALTMGKLVVHFALGGVAPMPEGAAYMKVESDVYVVSKETAEKLLAPWTTYKSRTIVPYLSLDLASLEIARERPRRAHRALGGADVQTCSRGPARLARAARQDSGLHSPRCARTASWMRPSLSPPSPS